MYIKHYVQNNKPYHSSYNSTTDEYQKKFRSTKVMSGIADAM